MLQHQIKQIISCALHSAHALFGQFSIKYQRPTIFNSLSENLSYIWFHLFSQVIYNSNRIMTHLYVHIRHSIHVHRRRSGIWNEPYGFLSDILAINLLISPREHAKQPRWVMRWQNPRGRPKVERTNVDLETSCLACSLERVSKICKSK